MLLIRWELKLLGVGLIHELALQ